LPVGMTSSGSEARPATCFSRNAEPRRSLRG
jgi:hypothetical protein